MRYAAFISYTFSDRKAANWLHRALETYRIPTRIHGRAGPFGPIAARLPPIFQDREELAASSDLAASVREALAESYSLIVICSPRAARSKWVNQEVREFTALGRRNHIQCLIIDGEPNASHVEGMDPALECLPAALFEQGGSEPMAADIRPGRDGRTSAKLKLIAGVIGVGYDELRDREHQRRHRRLMAIAASSAAGLVLTSGLATYAFLARAEAVRQRDIAREKTATAERTVDFVKSLFEVSDPSEARGAKVTAKEVLDRGAERIARSLGREPNVKAELMTTLSQVYQGLGVYHKGDAIIRQSLGLPVTDESVRARQYMALASADYRRGDYQQSVVHYFAALQHAERVQDRNPQMVASILAAMGDAKARAGTYADARKDIEAALKLDLEHLGPRDPAVARDLEALGYSHIAAEDYPPARKIFERALAIRIPQQGMDHPQVSEDLNELGSIAYLQHDSAAAEKYFRLALKADRLVLGPDHPDLAITANNLARVLLERRKFSEAQSFLRSAVAITEAQRDPDNDYFAFLYDNLAIAERGLGNFSMAERYLEKALAVANRHQHRNRGPILTDLAEIRCMHGRVASGLSLLDRAEPLMREDYPEDAWRAAWANNTRGYCLVMKGDRIGGRKLIDASLASIADRWPADSLYGTLARQRSGQAD